MTPPAIFSTLRIIGSAALFLVAPFAAAHGGSDVNWSITVGSPNPAPRLVYSPPPVYVQPQPVYVQPQPVYVRPQPVYVQPATVIQYGQPYYVEKRRHKHHHHHWKHQHDWRYGH